jgi:hypothetical protein
MPANLGLNLFRFCDESFFSSLLAKLESSEKFTLVIDTFVVEIRQRDTSDENRINLILVKAGSPDLEESVHSDVVLTGGCLQSTSLAMKSIDITSRLPAPDLIGKFLMEHFDGFVGTLRIRQKNVKTLRKLILDEDRKIPGCEFGVGLTIPNANSDISPPIDFHLEFDIDFNCYSNPILTSKRLKFGSKIFHSQDYSRIGPKKCNFIISYKSFDSTQYGIIKYFLQIHSEIFVALNNLSIINNLYEKLGARTTVELKNLRDQGSFDKFFCYCIESEKLIFIHSKTIISKCIAKRLEASKYIISEFIDLPDHS